MSLGEICQHMSSFQILSTQFRFDGWMDMNILTPHGVLSVEFQLDDESINALSILDFMQIDEDKYLDNHGQLDDSRLKILLILVKFLASKDELDRIEPFGWFQKHNLLNKSSNVTVN